MGEGTGVRAVDTLAVWCVALSAIIGLLALILRSLRQGIRKLSTMLDDWHGEPARPGFDGRPGMPQRVNDLEVDMRAVKGEMVGVKRGLGRLLLDSGLPGPDVEGLLEGGRRSAG